MNVLFEPCANGMGNGGMLGRAGHGKTSYAFRDYLNYLDKIERKKAMIERKRRYSERISPEQRWSAEIPAGTKLKALSDAYAPRTGQCIAREGDIVEVLYHITEQMVTVGDREECGVYHVLVDHDFNIMDLFELVPEVKELTIEEIQDKLGYKVKVVES